MSDDNGGKKLDAPPSQTPQLLQKEMQLDRRTVRAPTFEELRTQPMVANPVRAVPGVAISPATLQVPAHRVAPPSPVAFAQGQAAAQPTAAPPGLARAPAPPATVPLPGGVAPGAVAAQGLAPGIAAPPRPPAAAARPAPATAGPAAPPARPALPAPPAHAVAMAAPQARPAPHAPPAHAVAMAAPQGRPAPHAPPAHTVAQAPHAAVHASAGAGGAAASTTPAQTTPGVPSTSHAASPNASSPRAAAPAPAAVPGAPPSPAAPRPVPAPGHTPAAQRVPPEQTAVRAPPGSRVAVPAPGPAAAQAPAANAAPLLGMAPVRSAPTTSGPAAQAPGLARPSAASQAPDRAGGQAAVTALEAPLGHPPPGGVALLHEGSSAAVPPTALGPEAPTAPDARRAAVTAPLDPLPAAVAPRPIPLGTDPGHHVRDFEPEPPPAIDVSAPTGVLGAYRPAGAPRPPDPAPLPALRVPAPEVEAATDPARPPVPVPQPAVPSTLDASLNPTEPARPAVARAAPAPDWSALPAAPRKTTTPFGQPDPGPAMAITTPGIAGPAHHALLAADAPRPPTPAAPQPSAAAELRRLVDAGPVQSAARASAPQEAEQVVATPASLTRRLAAWVVDLLLLLGTVGAFLALASLVVGGRPSTSLAARLSLIALPAAALGALVTVVYTTLFAFLWQGRTPGRRLLGIHLVDGSGHAPSPGRALLRAVLSLVSFGLFLSGFWLALLDRRGQTLHDKLTRTFVVRLGQPSS